MSLPLKELIKIGENQLKEAYLLSMQEFYEVIQSQLKAVRRYRHDLAGHIQTLEWILKQCCRIRSERNISD